MAMPMRIMVGIGVLMFGGTAVAGEKLVKEVTINQVSRWAFGSLGGVRNSYDTTQVLACEISARGDSINGLCTATDANGATAFCTTTKPNMLEAIKSISDTSYVLFEWDAMLNCTAISVRNGSSYDPKR